jgi:hypothetical protein
VRWPIRFVLLVCCLCTTSLVAPQIADAASVSVRIESTTAPLVPLTSVTLPTTDVGPSGAADDQKCPGATVLGALDTATNGGWSGVWSGPDGWTIDTVKGVDAVPLAQKQWFVFVNGEVRNTSACQTALNDNDSVLLYPGCLDSAATGCYQQGPLDFAIPPLASPGALLVVQVFETDISFDSLGHIVGQRAPSLAARLSGPDGDVLTDKFYGSGTAAVSLSGKGPATIRATKSKYVPDRHSLCVTGGDDGYCGTTIPPANPFNPLDYCTTTGDDGECGSPDKRPPVSHITDPVQARSFPKGKGPDTLKGIVDRDPSEVASVQIRLKRQLTVTVKKTIKKKVRDKKTHKLKIRKRVVKRRETRCYSWSVSKVEWVRLKTCKLSAPWFKATGDQFWSYEFTAPIPGGSYSLDSKAIDGKGNVETAFEAARNSVTFRVL